MFDLKKLSRHFKIGPFAMLILVLAISFAFKTGSNLVPGIVYGYQQEVEVINQLSPRTINTGDEVFLASSQVTIKANLERFTENIYTIAHNDPTSFDKSLIHWLDNRCKAITTGEEHNSYFIWTEDKKSTIKELGNITRNLVFYSTLNSIVPYEGMEAIVIDKFLKLQPRETIIQQYCEAIKITDGTPTLIVVDEKDFPPLIGSVQTGSIIWIASNETRTEMQRSDYEVKGMPASLQFIMWSTQFTPSWTFTNQETAAFKDAAAKILSSNGYVLVDRNATLGNVAIDFLKSCPQVEFDSLLFTQMCLKTSAD